MTQVGNVTYMARLADEQVAFLQTVPMWFEAAWAVGVWFSVLGSVFLLARSRLAAVSFGLSLFGLFTSAAYTYGVASPNSWQISGSVAVLYTAVITVMLIAQVIYARAMVRRGVLR